MRGYQDRLFYFWWRKYNDGEEDALQLVSRSPKTVHKTPDKAVDRIIELRKETGWNEKAIAAKLKEEGIVVSHYTIYKYLSAKGLINRLKRKRRTKTYRSWSRKHPNSLWQTDLCIYKRQWLSTFLDDCSRYVVAIRLFKKGTADNIIDQFGDTISEHGTPKQVITDHGSPVLVCQERDFSIHIILQGTGHTSHPWRDREADNTRQNRKIPQNV